MRKKTTKSFSTSIIAKRMPIYWFYMFIYFILYLCVVCYRKNGENIMVKEEIFSQSNKSPYVSLNSKRILFTQHMKCFFRLCKFFWKVSLRKKGFLSQIHFVIHSLCSCVLWETERFFSRALMCVLV